MIHQRRVALVALSSAQLPAELGVERRQITVATQQRLQSLKLGRIGLRTALPFATENGERVQCHFHLEGQPRDVCKAEARADELVRKADLEAQYRGTVMAATDARLARAKASFEVAKARCGTERGEDKLSCLRSARAEKAKALEAAKLASI